MTSDPITADASPAPMVGSEDPAKRTSAWTPTGRLDLRRLDFVTRLLGISSLALFVALELPWYTTSPVSSTLGASGSSNAMVAGGWRYLIWTISLATALLVMLEANTAWRTPGWFRREQVLLGAAGANLLLVLVGCFVARQMPPLGRARAAVGQTVSMGVGAWLGLLFALGAALAAFFAWRLRLAAEDLPALTQEELHGSREVWAAYDRQTVEVIPKDLPTVPSSPTDVPAAVSPEPLSVEAPSVERQLVSVAPSHDEVLQQAVRTAAPIPELSLASPASLPSIVRPLPEFGLSVDVPERRHIVRNPVTPRARWDYQASYERSLPVKIAEPGSDPPPGWMPPQPPPPPPL